MKRRMFSSLALLAVAACGSSPDQESVATGQQDLYGLGSLAQAWPGAVVPVCFDNVAFHPELQAKIPGMLAASWSSASSLQFTGFGDCQYFSGNFVRVIFSDTPGFRGVTDSLGYGQRTVTLISDDTAPYKHFQYEVIHEFGHALGFAHEMERPDNWNYVYSPFGGIPVTPVHCGVPASDSDYGQYAPRVGGLYLTKTYDVASVMNYGFAPNAEGTGCNPVGYVQALSAGDITGVSQAYGIRGAYASPSSVSLYAGMQASFEIVETGTWSLGASPTFTVVPGSLASGITASFAAPNVTLTANPGTAGESGVLTVLVSANGQMHATSIPYSVTACPGTVVGDICCEAPSVAIGGVCVPPCCATSPGSYDCKPTTTQWTGIETGPSGSCTGGQIPTVVSRGPITCGAVGPTPTCEQTCNQDTVVACACPSGEVLAANGNCTYAQSAGGGGVVVGNPRGPVLLQ